MQDYVPFPNPFEDQLISISQVAELLGVKGRETTKAWLDARGIKPIIIAGKTNLTTRYSRNQIQLVIAEQIAFVHGEEAPQNPFMELFQAMYDRIERINKKVNLIERKLR